MSTATTPRLGQCVKRNTGPAVQRRLSTLSSNREIFLQAAPPYQAALDRAGHGHKLQYETHTQKKRQSTNRRKVTWFNPPFSLNVRTNIGAVFLKHLDACFPPGHPLHSLLNRHTVKISYRTMPNMAQIVSRHNSRTLRQHQSKTAEPVKTCSCTKAVRDSNSCPMAGQCLLENMIYQATVKQEVTGKEETYIGLASTSWKARLAVHTSSFKHRVKPGAKSQNSTELSKHVWAQSIIFQLNEFLICLSFSSQMCLLSSVLF